MVSSLRTNGSEAPLVSILLPSYNHEKFIGETLTSLLNLDYSDLELILVDDGSTDNTFDVIERFKGALEKKFCRVVILQNKHNGLGQNLNEMLNLVRGEYVFTCASDDMVCPHSVRILVDFLDKNPNYVLAVGDNAFIDASSSPCKVIFNGKCCTTLGQKLNLDSICSRNKFGDYYELLKQNHVPNGYLVRKSSYDATSGYSFALEDWGMNLQLSKLGKFKYFPLVLFKYRLHRKNTIFSKEYTTKIKSFYEEVYRRELPYNLGLKKLIKYGLLYIRYYLIRFYTPERIKRKLRKIRD
ncbi:MAG: glycosyltransferase family 2 protein [Parasutterella sp.]|uniref:glycosyltransferase family 2 protein n=1 Tax=Parasutterella sp. TaxID=2049037 RepID=UPI00399497A6